MRRFLMLLSVITLSSCSVNNPTPTATISFMCAKWIGYFSPAQVVVVSADGDTLLSDSASSEIVFDHMQTYDTNNYIVYVSIRCSGDVIIYHKYQCDNEWIIDNATIIADTTIKLN